MKIFTSSIIVCLVLTINSFSQVKSVDDIEFKSLAKYVTSEIQKGGRNLKTSKNYVSETVISKVVFRGCKVEIEKRYSYYNDSPGINSKVSSVEKADGLIVTRPFSLNTLIFNLTDLDAALFQIEPADEKDLVRLFLQTKSEDREIVTQSGNIPRFLSKHALLIRESASKKVLESLKTLTKMCQTKHTK